MDIWDAKKSKMYFEQDMFFKSSYGHVECTSKKRAGKKFHTKSKQL